MQHFSMIAFAKPFFRALRRKEINHVRAMGRLLLMDRILYTIPWKDTQTCFDVAASIHALDHL